MLGELIPPENLLFNLETNPLYDGGRHDLQNSIDSFPGVGLLIIDTLGKIRDPMKRVSQNVYAADYHDLSELKKSQIKIRSEC